jgi:hypothetical protein
LIVLMITRPTGLFGAGELPRPRWLRWPWGKRAAEGS